MTMFKIIKIAKECGAATYDLGKREAYLDQLRINFTEGQLVTFAAAIAKQADQAEYIGLLELNNKFKEAEIDALKADNEIYVSATSDFVNENAKLRKALEACKYDCHTGEVIGIAKEALGETK